MRDRECRKAEIRLGLAAARRKEEQVDDLAVRVGLIDQAGEVQQDEGELKRSPLRRPLGAWVECSRVSAARCRGDRVSAPGGARHCLVHDPESQSGAVIVAQQNNSGANSCRCRLHALNQTLGRLASTRRESANRVPLRGDPGIIENGQRGDVRGKRLAALRCESRKCFHAELDLGDVLVRRHPLDLGERQMVGADAPHNAVPVDIPGGSSIAADRVLLDIAVVQIGEPQILVGGTVAGEVVARQEPLRTDELEPSLEGVGDIGIAPLHRRAPIDQEDGDGSDMLFLPVGQRNREGSGMHRQLQRTPTGNLRRTAVGDPLPRRWARRINRDRQHDRALLAVPAPNPRVAEQIRRSPRPLPVTRPRAAAAR